jgi:hypothetical protein
VKARAGRAALALALLLPPLGGCGVIALIHDKMLGPVSPLGEVHAAAVGAHFTVSETGVTGDVSREPTFRPLPPNLPDRGRPQRYWDIVQGMVAFIRGISFVVWGESRTGVPLDPQRLERLTPGISAQEALEALGTPNLWLRRQGGSLMAYKAELETFFAFYIGMPPFVDNFNPIPGLSSLSFRWNYRALRPYKTLLFFDADERLTAWVKNDPDRELELDATAAPTEEERE